MTELSIHNLSLKTLICNICPDWQGTGLMMFLYCVPNLESLGFTQFFLRTMKSNLCQRKFLFVCYIMSRRL
ncbi:hypothetical protein GQ457_13G020730 [Hibiscus cannabinus]